MACRKVLRHKIICQAQCLHVTKLSLWFAQVHRVQNNISKSAMHRSVYIIASLLGIKLLVHLFSVQLLVHSEQLAVRPKEASDGFHTIGDVMPLTASAHVVACATACAVKMKTSTATIWLLLL